MKDLRDFVKNYEGNYRKNGGILNDIRNLSVNHDILPLDDNDFVYDTLENLDSFISQKDDVIKMVKLPGIIASLAIALSLSFLAFTNQTMDPMTLWLITGLALFGFLSIVRASWKIIDAIKRLE